MTPASTRSTISPVAAFRPSPSLALRTSLTTTEPSKPAFSAIWRSGSSSARRTIFAPVFSSSIVERVEVDGVDRLEQRDAAARHDALLEGRAGGLQRVLDAVLLLLHLRLGGRADLHDGDAAGQLGEALLELLAVEVGVGVLDLGLDLVDAALDGLRVTGAVDDRGVVLRHDDATGAAELRELRVLELEAHLLGDDLAAGEDGDVLEHALAAVAEARRLDGDAGEGAAQLVHDERREGLALDVLGDDQQRLAGLDDLLEDREQVPDRADLLVGDEDVRDPRGRPPCGPGR